MILLLQYFSTLYEFQVWMTCKDVLAQFRNAETNSIVYIHQLYFLPLLHVYMQSSSVTCMISHTIWVCKIGVWM